MPLSLSKLYAGPAHIHGMLDRSKARRRPRIRRVGAFETPWQRRWTKIVDWLGARRPPDLILGSMILITMIATIARSI